MSGDRPLVAVLDYGIGNLRSAQKALEHVGADARLTADSSLVDEARAVVLPGVGAFGACMAALRAARLDDTVHAAIAAGKPFLGICVGMQMLFEGSDESPGVEGLGVFAGRVRWIEGRVPRPQMQWNQLQLSGDDPLFEGLGEAPWMYFVHSLAPEPADPAVVTASVGYGTRLTVAVRRNNVAAVQFHPEKSSTAGLALLANFVAGADGSLPSDGGGPAPRRGGAE